MKKYYDDRKQINMEISDAKDGIMQIKLHLPIGVKNLIVTEAEGKEILELNRVEYADNHRETRRHVSLEAYDPSGALLEEHTNPYQEVINRENTEQLYKALFQLKPAYQKLVIDKFWKDMKQIDIAKDEDVTKMAITKRFQTIYGRLKKNLKK
ncbi:sigma-70 family RNA polymerase sigma factor [Lactobacillus sp. W8092]|nr:sigma-70 family RNA polymerase sigma factor [Lactobacillus sp. W8092]